MGGDDLVEVVVVRGTDFERARRNDIRDCPRRFVPRRTLSARLLDTDCVVIEASGGSKDQAVGRTLLVRAELLASTTFPISAASFCKILRVDARAAAPRFVCAVLENAYSSGEIERFQTQSTGLRNLRMRQLLPGLRFRLPGLASQARIAAVLSAFDEHIDINERRIELLENQARCLYRHWFVHFRFPNHERDEIVTSDYGPLPAGWKLTDLGSAAQWFSGGTPPTKRVDYWRGDIPWISSGSLKTMLLDDSKRKVTHAGAEAGSRMVGRDAVLCVVRGMSLVREFRVGIAERPVAFGQDIKALVAHDGIEPLYLAFSVFERQDEIQGMAELAGHGTGKLSTDRLMGVRFPVPPQDLQRRFAESIELIRRLMSELIGEGRRLTAIRDLLLPRLVTGQLDVSTIDLGGLLPADAA